ncbi:hypothetical protein ACFX13_013230 [Malus domestica]|uniref:uncharacterized protein n=1 Tax=Malus domestica TaxID=3750 RepID=UPI00397538D4
MENRSKRKRKPESDDISDDTAFAVVLAALSSLNPNSLRPLINKCLNKLHHSITDPTLSLLPTLLTFNSPAISRRAAEMVGSAALESLDMNQRIASDADIINSLLSALASSNTGVSVAACNALLDLCTTGFGRRRLLDSYALPRILSGFLQVHKSLENSVSFCSVSVDSGGVIAPKIGFKGDELPVLLLSAAVLLINTCKIEQLENIPTNLSHVFFAFMRNLWVKVRNEMVFESQLESTQGGHLHISNIRISDIAETLFRLSICASQLIKPLPFHVVERGIFGFSESGFKDFISNQWEVSPFLVRRGHPEGDLVEENDSFGPFVRSLNSTGAFPSFLSSMLPRMVSCLPIASDEFNILTFLGEVKNKLGCPLTYQQDIRVLRTDGHLKREEHFFLNGLNSCCTKDPHYLGVKDVLKCEEAYKEGYTVALRGMEFRFESVAAIADGLASLFGQPSIGANMYLTPPDSQGLARHYDDHCVFICQLVGTKKWRLYPQSNVHLPRLYDPLDRLHASEVQSSPAECKQFLLREGDILYIPRGVLHEACTENVSFDGSDGNSLHLTLGIEVEPPFEWEGFVHVALFSWNQNQKKAHNLSEYSSGIIHDISVNLLHAAIVLIGDSDSTFRKACLVASVFSQSHIHNWLDLNQRIIFCQLIDKIKIESQFLKVFRNVELAIQKSEDPFQRIRWLGFLNTEEESSPNCEQNMHLMGMKNLFTLCSRHKGKVEATFQQLTSRFSSEVIFDDAIERYKILLETYRRARKQYMNGMVSLHYEL